MLENILTQKQVSTKTKISIKSLVSVVVVALAVGLPQLVHIAAGAAGGAQWLPMYLPVLIGGCLLGTWWGLGVGVASPIVSFLITLAAGNPMPALARLPYMVAELAVFAAVSGAFSKKIMQNDMAAFPAVLLAATLGRSVFIILAAAFQSVSKISLQMAWAQVQTGLLAVLLQAVIVPVIVIAAKHIMLRNRENND